MQENKNGLVIYDGESCLTDDRIVCIVTGFQHPTSNIKTGDMLQSFILCADQNPIDSVQEGEDEAVCGDCPHRGTSCYVNIYQGVSQIYRCWKENAYKTANAADLDRIKARLFRFGSYGDPAALPFELIETLAQNAKGHTGYTHQWRKCSPKYMKYLMASCDSEKDYEDAHKMGYRTFRVKKAGDRLLKGEFACPASPEGGNKLTCNECLACDGGKPPKGSVVINVHGSPVKLRQFKKWSK